MSTKLQLVPMLATFRHLFTPHHTNNHRPHLLHPQGMAILVGIFLFSHAAISLLAQVKGNVLGFASNITPEQVLTGINAKRAESGLSALSLNSQLNHAATMKASDMFTLNYWAHTNPQGKEPWYFVKAAGYKYRYAGENLARDFGDTDSMIDAWMASPTHRDNIINSRYTQTGIAVVNGTLQGVETTLVVNFFGAPASRSLVSGIQTPVQAQEPIPTPLPREASSEVEPSSTFLLSPLIFEKVTALSITLLLILVLAWDTLHARRLRLVRLVGKNAAHLLFITFIIILVTLASGGGVL